MLAIHNSFTLPERDDDYSLLLDDDDVITPSWDPSLYLRRLPDRFAIDGKNSYIEPMTRLVYWLNDGAALRRPIETKKENDNPNPSTVLAEDSAHPQGGEAPAANSVEINDDDCSNNASSGDSMVAQNASTRAGDGTDTSWIKQSYEDEFHDLPWISGERDEYGNPKPLQPPHLSAEIYKVKSSTPDELDTVMETIGVTDHEKLTDDEKLLLRHAVAYSWGTFDDVMRPVDGPPVQLKFKDANQTPVKMAPYRMTPDKIECLRLQIAEWEDSGILRRGSSPSPWDMPAILLPKKGGEPGTSNAFRLVVDFRVLNDLLEDNSYNLPNTEDAPPFFAGKPFRSFADIGGTTIAVSVTMTTTSTENHGPGLQPMPSLLVRRWELGRIFDCL